MKTSLKKHILIVEDSTDLQLLLARLLSKEGYTLSNANNGQEALDILRTSTQLPSLILLDIMMPVMDGFAFRKEQVKDAKLSRIPVIVMTADTHPETKAESMKAAGFLPKPIDMDQLLQMAENLSA